MKRPLLALLSFILTLPVLSRRSLDCVAESLQSSNQTSSQQPNYLETGRQITGILDRFMSLGYDKRVRPNYGGPPVSVNVTMRILSISSVSEVMMDFTADFYFRQTWHDPRLSFKKLGDIQTLYVGAEVSKKIWLPDTFFGNEKLAYFHEATTPNVFLRIDHSGEVYRSIRLTVTSSCPMNLQYFPMDKQRCTIEAESYGYNIKDIIYRWARRDTAVERDKEISLPQFDIVKTVQKYRLEELSSGTYSRLIAEIHFARRMGYYLIQIYIPSSLIVVISWVSFWLHRNASPARVQLGVTTVLTMTTLMSSTNAALPKISYVKSIDIFLGTCFIMVFAALLEYATVGYLGKRIAMRKAQAQHSQSQAQARLFAQLQAQGAQGDPVPPVTASQLLAAPPPALVNPTSLNPLDARNPLTTRQAVGLSSQANVFGGPEHMVPAPPQRTHLGCHSCLPRHNEAAQSTSCCQLQELQLQLQPQQQCCPTARSSRRNHLQATCQCNASNNHHHQHHHHHHQNQNLNLTLNQHQSLPRNIDLAATALELAAADKQLQAMHLANSGGAVFRDHQASAAAESGLLNPGDTCPLPPSYTGNKASGGSSAAAAAAAAAAATFVNMHRRSKGLPPSTNPNFAQFAWVGKHDRNLETIFGVRPSDIDKYSRVVFPVCFVCFQLMYWIVYLHISAFLESEQQQQQQTA